MPAVTVLEDGARRRLIMNLTQVWTTYMVLGYSMRICLSKKKKKACVVVWMRMAPEDHMFECLVHS